MHIWRACMYEMNACIYKYACMYVCACVYVCSCMCVYGCACDCVYMCVWLCAGACMCVPYLRWCRMFRSVFAWQSPDGSDSQMLSTGPTVPCVTGTHGQLPTVCSCRAAGLSICTHPTSTTRIIAPIPVSDTRWMPRPSAIAFSWDRYWQWCFTARTVANL